MERELHFTPTQRGKHTFLPNCNTKRLKSCWICRLLLKRDFVDVFMSLLLRNSLILLLPSINEKTKIE